MKNACFIQAFLMKTIELLCAYPLKLLQVFLIKHVKQYVSQMLKCVISFYIYMTECNDNTNDIYITWRVALFTFLDMTEMSIFSVKSIFSCSFNSDSILIKTRFQISCALANPCNIAMELSIKGLSLQNMRCLQRETSVGIQSSFIKVVT